MCGILATRVAHRRLAVAFVLFTLSLGHTSWAEDVHRIPLAVVVNAANPLTDLSMAELRAILLNERSQWPDGRRITVVLREQGHAERVSLLQQTCTLTESGYTKHLLHKSFVGAPAREPKVLTSPEGVQRFVFNVPGAIGFLPADLMGSSLKTVRLDGLLPGAAGYPLTVP